MAKITQTEYRSQIYLDYVEVQLIFAKVFVIFSKDNANQIQNIIYLWYTEETSLIIILFYIEAKAVYMSLFL